MNDIIINMIVLQTVNKMFILYIRMELNSIAGRMIALFIEEKKKLTPEMYE